mmetsp:Transcript_18256/g.54099  ORF Transcript_18256/g.54099 Transcript_18256/m.54099 type:complete len:219 (-) Transcript_18256:29-685(-)
MAADGSRKFPVRSCAITFTWVSIGLFTPGNGLGEGGGGGGGGRGGRGGRGGDGGASGGTGIPPVHPLVQFAFSSAAFPAVPFSQQHRCPCSQAAPLSCGCHVVNVKETHLACWSVQHRCAQSATVVPGKCVMVSPSLFVLTRTVVLQAAPGGPGGVCSNSVCHVTTTSTERAISWLILTNCTPVAKVDDNRALLGTVLMAPAVDARIENDTIVEFQLL